MGPSELPDESRWLLSASQPPTGGGDDAADAAKSAAGKTPLRSRTVASSSEVELREPQPQKGELRGEVLGIAARPLGEPAGDAADDDEDVVVV